MNRYKVKSVLNILLLGVIASIATIGCKNKPSAVDQYGEVQLVELQLKSGDFLCHQ